MLRLVDDLLPLCQAVAEGRGLPPRWRGGPEAAVCVVLASGGYPGGYATGLPIEGIERAEARPGVTVFHAGTARRDGDLVTAGGRVLGVTALGADIRAAVAAAYAAAAGDPLRRRPLPAGHRPPRPPAPMSGPDRGSSSTRAGRPRRRSRRRPASCGPAGSSRFPTETFYGLGADALDERRWPASSRSRAGRTTSRSSCWWTRSPWWGAVAREVSALARALMARHWPGPLDAGAAGAPARSRPASRRAPARSACGCPGTPWPGRSWRRSARPVTAPSANPHGGASPRTAAEVIAALGGRRRPHPGRRRDAGRPAVDRRGLTGWPPRSFARARWSCRPTISEA